MKILSTSSTLTNVYVFIRAFVPDLFVFSSPTPSAAAVGKVSRCYSGALNTKVAESMLKMNPNGPLMIHVTKLYAFNKNNGGIAGQTFSALGRIYSGSVKAGDKVRVLGEAYSLDDDEDMAFATVESVAIPRGRFRTEVTVARAGSWVLLDGVDANISKTATIIGVKQGSSYSGNDDVEIFAPLKFTQVSVQCNSYSITVIPTLNTLFPTTLRLEVNLS